MSTMSFSILPREQASCLPSFDQSNQKDLIGREVGHLFGLAAVKRLIPDV